MCWADNWLEVYEQVDDHELIIDNGRFWHVYTPWFAPQSLVTSASNMKVVAANDAALQHYGQQVGCGHVTTNSGRRVLIPITSDVMSVRTPFRSTSALQGQGVTIIFNHDYDRIIFRNEAVNLASHDCHSYLHVRLAHGTPSHKAMVMTGECVSNDVDEEVHEGEGDETSVAREASGGDWRAIADADPRALRIPKSPTDTARMLHNMTHVPFRGNTQWRWIRRLDTRNDTSLRVLRFSQSGDFAMRHRDEYHRRVQESCT